MSGITPQGPNLAIWGFGTATGSFSEPPWSRHVSIIEFQSLNVRDHSQKEKQEIEFQDFGRTPGMP
eukprot:1157315-Pelagomonas_calceolata.AAC.10